MGTLLLGDSVIDQTDKKGGDRGIRLSGSNNTLTIYADRIVSYTGDEFIHVRQGNGSSVANIGSADRRIGYFEAHTGWGKDDYGVALLQANEGNKVFLYADEAVLDGSTNSQGGVIGSGGWGEVHVDANKLTINGNICGSYGTMSNADKQLTLSVRAGTLDMTGDINVGNEAKGNSNFDRNTTVEIEADVLNLKGDIKVDNNKRTGSKAEGDNISAVNLTVNKTANIIGTIIASQTDGTSTVTLGGAGDATASSGKYEVTGDGSSIVFKDSGSWVINEWKGTDGNLTASDSVKVQFKRLPPRSTAHLHSRLTTAQKFQARHSKARAALSSLILLMNRSSTLVTTRIPMLKPFFLAARTISMRQLTKQSKLWKPLSALIQS